MRREILFSLIAAVLILSNAVGLSVVTMWFPRMMPTLPGTPSNDPVIMYGLSIVGMVLGFPILLSSVLLKLKSNHRKAWSAIVLVSSVPSVIMGGGFIVGFILGTASGILAFSIKNNVSTTKDTEA